MIQKLFKAEPVQGLQYFATGTTGGLSGLQAQQLLVYPGGGVGGAGHIFIPAQVM
ncbi:unnamed protein product [Timema podura]|uniref:Uncharacterized protein n=1 Tax=Timema podura TaxID=61482 RepID=A0ABN7PK97_TIMPD|nr:unnamed protein product [Timema podura]